MSEFNTVGEAIAARNARLEEEHKERDRIKGQAARHHYAVRDAHKPAKEMKPEDVRAKYSDRIRYGKTARDRANGAVRRAAERKLARAAWHNTNRVKSGDGSGLPGFPV